jgi:hypothetical protein
MAGMHKQYRQSPLLLYNLANDIVEMYKARVTQDDGEHLGFVLDMYGKKTDFLFCITELKDRKDRSDGSDMYIETQGEGQKTEQKLTFMFALVDNMLASLNEQAPFNERVPNQASP